MSKKQKIIVTIILLLSPFIILILARILNIYAFHKLPTVSMEPKFKIGERIFSTTLLNTKVGDAVTHIVFPTFYERLYGVKGQYIAISRILAQADDTVEIRNGTLFINNHMEKDTLTLSYNFEVNNNSVEFIVNDFLLQSRAYQISKTKSILNLSYNELIGLNILGECKRVLDTNTTYVSQAGFISNNLKKWTIDNFGPIVVPKDYYFLLSDNRSNAIDSRYRGCIYKDNIIAKIIE